GQRGRHPIVTAFELHEAVRHVAPRQLAALAVNLIVVEIFPTGSGKNAEGNLLRRARRPETCAAGDHPRDMPVARPVEGNPRPARETRHVHSEIVDGVALDWARVALD